MLWKITKNSPAQFTFPPPFCPCSHLLVNPFRRFKQVFMPNHLGTQRLIGRINLKVIVGSTQHNTMKEAQTGFYVITRRNFLKAINLNNVYFVYIKETFERLVLAWHIWRHVVPFRTVEKKCFIFSVNC